ncbi:unnamed protein product, partial [Tetraodon nigroviridis]
WAADHPGAEWRSPGRGPGELAGGRPPAGGPDRGPVQEADGVRDWCLVGVPVSVCVCVCVLRPSAG